MTEAQILRLISDWHKKTWSNLYVKFSHKFFLFSELKAPTLVLSLWCFLVFQDKGPDTVLSLWFFELITLLTYFMFSFQKAGHPLDWGVLHDGFAWEIFSDPQFGIFPAELHLGVILMISWVSRATGICGFIFSFRCILGFRQTHTLRDTGCTSHQQIKCTNWK